MANVRRLVRLASLTLPTLLAACAALTRAAEIGDAELIRQLERQRLRSLVDVDLDTARCLHRDDFQLITPSGAVVTKEAYLAILESGQLNYVAWEAGDITVKLFGDPPSSATETSASTSTTATRPSTAAPWSTPTSGSAATERGKSAGPRHRASSGPEAPSPRPLRS